MKKKWLIGGSCVVLLILGYGFYFSNSRNHYVESLVSTRNDAQQIAAALTDASLERTGKVDSWLFWPKSYGVQRDRGYSNSTEFFSLFIDAIKTDNVTLGHEQVFNDKGLSKWTIMMDISKSTPAELPVILSSNVDPQTLLILLADDSLIDGRSLKDKIGYGLVFKKDKNMFFVSPEYFTSGRAKRHGNSKLDTTDWPPNISYLTPTGIISITLHVSK